MNKPHEKVKFIDSWLINYCQLRKYTTFPFEELYKGPGSSGWGAGTAMGVRGFLFRISKPIIAQIQEKTMSQLVCCYLACEQGGKGGVRVRVGGGGGGMSFFHSLLFSPTPLGELARMLNHCHCFNTSLCHL